jgi:hypothetical protein
VTAHLSINLCLGLIGGLGALIARGTREPATA